MSHLAKKKSYLILFKAFWKEICGVLQLKIFLLMLCVLSCEQFKIPNNNNLILCVICKVLFVL